MLYTSKLVVCMIEGHGNPSRFRAPPSAQAIKLIVFRHKKCVFAFRGCDVIIHGSAGFEQ